MTAKSYINIEGQTLDPANLTLPQDRENRGAWTLNGDIVEVDQARVTALKEAKAAELEEHILSDVGALRAIADVIADVAFRVASGNLPAGLTEAKAKTYVRQQLRAKIREELELPLDR